MNPKWQLIMACMVISLPLTAGAFPWDKDMVDQPSAKPQESEAPPEPANSIPVHGGEIVPAPTTQADMYTAKDEAVAISNPVAPTTESIERGAALYATNCLVCHGESGIGDGPVGKKFDTEPADLNDEYTQDQADGQLFFTLTRGRDAMPFYRDALSQRERWDVINYLRKEFGSQ
jgi:mono/diheme cytochrome c family protein